MYRRCCVRHDEMGQAVLLNLLMRNYLHYNLYDQAYTLASKVTLTLTLTLTH
jgi:26S proteasome regulatory subunit N3